MTNPVSSKVQTQFYRSHQANSFSNNTVKWLNKARTATKDAFDSLAVKVPLDIAKTAHYVFAATNDIFELLTNVKPAGALLEAKKIAILPLFSIPITLYAFLENLIDFGYTAKDGCSEAIAHAALAATAAFGDVVEIPAKIGGVVNLFQPVAQFAVWSTSLYAVSAILSIAGLILAALSHEKTRDFAAQLKDKSQDAVLTEIFTNDRYTLLRKKLRGMGPSAGKKLDKEFFKALKAITHCHDKKELNATINKFSQKLGNLSLADWRSLEEVSDMAYLHCLEDMNKRDSEILNKNFEVDGKKISTAIARIKNCN
ncbi:MAG: hypothetical protein H0U49_12375, partial [Parachlamydiaceae bacterium]|nr:hypothetical protein [Parachlamydiaceae bacterium]